MTLAFSISTVTDTASAAVNDELAINEETENIQNTVDNNEIVDDQAADDEETQTDPNTAGNDEIQTTTKNDEITDDQAVDNEGIETTTENDETANDQTTGGEETSTSTYAVTGTPEIVFTFDDGYESVYTCAYPVMEQYGIKGTVFINPVAVGQPGYLTLEELQELHNSGWIIANHANEHFDLTTLNKEDTTYQIQTCINWLTDNGFEDGSYHFATPYGAYNDEILEVCKELGIKIHRTDTGGFVTCPPDDLLHIPDKVIPPYYTIDQANAIVDKAIAKKATVFMLLHDLAENPDENQWSVANFSGLISYVSQIEVKTLTIDEWYNEVTDSIAPAVYATPAGGDYYAPQNVVLGASEISSIYYTLDGTDPTTISNKYQGSINIGTSNTLKFVAVDEAGNSSPTYTENYRIYTAEPYSYVIPVPYRQVWYKLSYRKWYKYHGKWRYRTVYLKTKHWYKYKGKWRYKWINKWAYYWLYRNETRWDSRYVLT